MSLQTEFPSSWADPRYVAAVVGVLAVGAVGVFTGTNPGGQSGATFAFLFGVVLFAAASAPVVAERFL
ncbi:hypothetical protein [Haloarchaeobius sp. DFWS5]|uniref:hypothetical protein n=1 Tax=Haloarchaeobius sp. DFWS5 TaxID=3446114 RepID=UPI003EB7149F